MPASPLSAPSPPDVARIADTVRRRLPFPARFLKMTTLAGDASNRRYFRLELDGRPASAVLMQLASPEAFKQSEEAVSGGAPAIAELPFLNVQRQLAAVGVPVPTLYHYDEVAGLLYLEDFGDQTLADACAQAMPARIEALYREAIDVLVAMHRQATDTGRSWLAYTRGFDVPLLMWEFEHFLEYGIVARHGKPICADDEKVIKGEFHTISELIASAPRVFTHRDYHSRNLMVRATTGPTLGVLDFQDALLGPASYDLASLLRDAYIALDEPLIDTLIDVYLDGIAHGGALRTDRAAFRRLFDLTSIQRNLKAAGRFVYIDRVKGNPKFLADIPRVLGYVRQNLEKYSELAALRRHLTPYVPELQ